MLVIHDYSGEFTSHCCKAQAGIHRGVTAEVTRIRNVPQKRHRVVPVPMTPCRPSPRASRLSPRPSRIRAFMSALTGRVRSRKQPFFIDGQPAKLLLGGSSGSATGPMPQHTTRTTRRLGLRPRPLPPPFGYLEVRHRSEFGRFIFEQVSGEPRTITTLTLWMLRGSDRGSCTPGSRTRAGVVFQWSLGMKHRCAHRDTGSCFARMKQNNMVPEHPRHRRDRDTG